MLKAVVLAADAVNPRLSPGWLDYAQHVGVRHRPDPDPLTAGQAAGGTAVQYVGGNFWAGESFTELADAQNRVEIWCRERAGMRVHGTTARRPAEMFAELEAGCLLPLPEPYDQPVFTRVKVHRDYHVEVARPLYSVPEHLLGSNGRPRRQPARVISSSRAVLTSQGGR